MRRRELLRAMALTPIAFLLPGFRRRKPIVRQTATHTTHWLGQGWSAYEMEFRPYYFLVEVGDIVELEQWQPYGVSRQKLVVKDVKYHNICEGRVLLHPVKTWKPPVQIFRGHIGGTQGCVRYACVPGRGCECCLSTRLNQTCEHWENIPL